MKINIAYGLPGSGKTKLLTTLSEINNSVYISFDEPNTRKYINKFFDELDYSDDCEYYVDFLVDDITKILTNINEKSSNGVIVIIHRFEPNINQCIKNDRCRSRDLSSIPTIRHMKIIKLNELELNERFTNIKILVNECDVYVGDNK